MKPTEVHELIRKHSLDEYNKVINEPVMSSDAIKGKELYELGSWRNEYVPKYMDFLKEQKKQQENKDFKIAYEYFKSKYPELIMTSVDIQSVLHELSIHPLTTVNLLRYKLPNNIVDDIINISVDGKDSISGFYWNKFILDAERFEKNHIFLACSDISPKRFNMNEDTVIIPFKKVLRNDKVYLLFKLPSDK